MAAKKAASSAPGPDFYLGTTWEPNSALKMGDPIVPMPVDDPDAGEQQLRRAHGYGYSDYT
jgi:hypothetical protein